MAELKQISKEWQEVFQAYPNLRNINDTNMKKIGEIAKGIQLK